MADTCATYTFGSVTINNTTGDTLFLDYEEGEITGLDGAPIRSQIDPQGQSDGGIVHNKLYGPRIISFHGKVLIRTVPIEPKETYVAAVNALESSTISALESLLNTPTALQWTPTGGGSAKSIQATYGTEGGEIQFFGNMIEHSFTFTVVAADPTIS